MLMLAPIEISSTQICCCDFYGFGLIYIDAYIFSLHKLPNVLLHISLLCVLLSLTVFFFASNLLKVF